MLGAGKGIEMLILTRRLGEAINIGDNIKVTVLGMRRAEVKIGITAPVNIPVHREEVYERIQKTPGTGSTK